MGNDSLALNKIIAGLHARILEKDVTAHVELAELLLPILTKKLSKVFPNVYDKDFIDIAVTDALLNYFDDPSKYLSEKRSLTGYLLMSAKGDLLNQLKRYWNNETQSNAIFISATEKMNVDELRITILDKVKELYGIRYPYKTMFYE